MLIFVYGTLKHGKRLHYILDKLRAKFIGDGYVEDFALYYSGVPMAVRSPGSRLKGELYEVNTVGVMALDFVETGYKRIPVSVTNNSVRMFDCLCGSDLKCERHITAYMYEWPIRKHHFDPRDERDRVHDDNY